VINQTSLDEAWNPAPAASVAYNAPTNVYLW